jgi:hypothetical protein
MKKTIGLLLLVTVWCYQLNSQSIYYDAEKLKRWASISVTELHFDSLAAVLSNYMPANLVDPSDAVKTIKNFKALNNPFFNSYFEVGNQLSPPSFSRAISSIGSSIGGINVTNFADGLAKFLVKRFKEELSITFFEKFEEALNDPKFEEMRILFPQTVAVLRIIHKEIYNFSKYLNSLREAFIKDLGNLYTALKRVKNLPKYQQFFNTHPEINTVVVNAFYFIDQFTAGVHPGDVIAGYNEDLLLTFSNGQLQTNLRSSVKILKLFSSSLKSVSPDHYWVPADSARVNLVDPVFRDMYFGLIYQKSENISFQTNSGLLPFRELLKKAKTAETVFQEYQAHVERIIDHAQEVNEYIAAIKEKKKSEIDYNDYYKLFNASLDIMDEGFLIVDLPALDINSALLDAAKVKITELMSIARSASNLYTDVRTRNYSSAVLNVVSLLDEILGSSFDNDLRENIIKYGTFIATVAAAENSDEVEEAIEAIALPVGSSRVKRETLKNIALNAYVGGYVGGEYMPTLKENPNAFVFGLSAPVGVSFSIGNFWRGSDEKKKKGGKSLSLFISIIDIGALATYRMNDDNSKVAAEIKLENIISPGAFLYFGFGKCPISLGAGVQLGPQLREVTTTDIDIEKNYYIRYGITLAVDIPLLNFYTKSK